MSYYVTLDKSPKSPEERKQLLAKFIEHEAYLDSLEISNIQRKIIEFLLYHKGYQNRDIEVNKIFTIELEDESFNTYADLVINLNNKKIIFIKCVSSSIDSWERYSIAFCRAADDFQIPYAIITDGETVKFINIHTAFVLEGGLELIPSRDEGENNIKETTFTPYPEKRKRIEKRIIYAFEGIKCPVKKDL